MNDILLITNIQKHQEEINLKYDPRCFDNNLHIRLREFKSGDVIAGFESKLTFIIEYFLHLFIKSFPTSSVDFNIKDDSKSTRDYIFSKYINEFKQTDSFKNICLAIKSDIDFDDILIKPVYSKKKILDKKAQFGNILSLVDEKLNLGLSMRNFILDDSFSLLISETTEDLNEKYINKNARKIAREIKLNNGYEENKLW